MSEIYVEGKSRRTGRKMARRQREKKGKREVSWLEEVNECGSECIGFFMLYCKRQQIISSAPLVRLCIEYECCVGLLCNCN